jgi:hypothetical protein
MDRPALCEALGYGVPRPNPRNLAWSSAQAGSQLDYSGLPARDNARTIARCCAARELMPMPRREEWEWPERGGSFARAAEHPVR